MTGGFCSLMISVNVWRLHDPSCDPDVDTRVVAQDWVGDLAQISTPSFVAVSLVVFTFPWVWGMARLPVPQQEVEERKIQKRKIEETSDELEAARYAPADMIEQGEQAGVFPDNNDDEEDETVDPEPQEVVHPIRRRVTKKSPP